MNQQKHLVEPTINENLTFQSQPSGSQKVKIEQLEKKIEEQRIFYEDALEKRFNQMEEYEEKAEVLEQDAASLKAELREANFKIDELEADKHQLTV